MPAKRKKPAPAAKAKPKGKPKPRARAAKPKSAPKKPTAKKPAGANPLRALRAAKPHSAARPLPFKFEGGEHAWLGNAGVELACADLRARTIAISEDDFMALKRRHGNETFQYGELVALSGDFYGTPEDLFDERPALIPWLWEENDLSDIRSCSHRAGVDQRPPAAEDAKYPDNNVRMAWNAKSYIELALRNTAHFGWHNRSRT